MSATLWVLSPDRCFHADPAARVSTPTELSIISDHSVLRMLYESSKKPGVPAC